ncbi:MAG: hypothetical protein IT353_10675 [Gemmatimonadaceae bacterium]|nr:hypothetical protein [Gemmatimonadaceae bacterium]
MNTPKSLLVLALVVLLGAGPHVFAQSTPPRSAEQLASAMTSRFLGIDTVAFHEVYPHADGRELHGEAVRRSLPRQSSVARVLTQSRQSAVLLFGGVVRFGNTGDETSASRALSGVYRARRSTQGAWTLGSVVPFGTMASIRRHHLFVNLRPGRGIDVTDTLDLDVRSQLGAALRLNHRASHVRVSANSKEIQCVAGDGLLWLPLPAGRHRVIVTYTIDVAADSASDANSGRFAERFGHLRGQYYWHPFIDHDDAAAVRITVRSPRDIVVATDLAQRVSDRADYRVTEGIGDLVATLSLFYDAEWVPEERVMGPLRFSLFARPDFEPSAAELAAAFQKAYTVFDAQFGPPSGEYVAVVQQRTRDGVGWPFMSNAVIAANASGGALMSRAPRPRAFFAHEVAHRWTRPIGRGRNFLSEGWATFAESLALDAEFGDSVGVDFWRSQRALYRDGNFDGIARLDRDDRNAGVSYAKGAWVLRMLEVKIGARAFRQGMRVWMAREPRRATLAQFVSDMSQASGTPLRNWFAPWLEGTVVPHLSARVADNFLEITQHQKNILFKLDVDVDLATEAGSTRVRVPLRKRTARVPLPPGMSSPVVATIDPLVQLLFMERAR